MQYLEVRPTARILFRATPCLCIGALSSVEMHAKAAKLVPQMSLRAYPAAWLHSYHFPFQSCENSTATLSARFTSGYAIPSQIVLSVVLLSSAAPRSEIGKVTKQGCCTRRDCNQKCRSPCLSTWVRTERRASKEPEFSGASRRLWGSPQGASEDSCRLQLLQVT